MLNIQKVLAPNPSVYTGPGTNTYLLGSVGEMAIIDPGPIDSSHRDAIDEAVGDTAVRFVLVTHTHSDHAPLANPLAHHYGVPAVGFAPGPGFVPDEAVVDGDTLVIGESDLQVLFTPGHSDDHVCFLADRILFTGDHIMGGSTVMVSDLTKYLASLEKLKGVAISRMMPGHGPEIDDPSGVIDHYISHRLEREQEVLMALRRGAGSVGSIVTEIYKEVDTALHPLAAFSVAAHLRKLVDDNRIEFHEQDADELWDALVTLVSGA
jgi:glyoxylase-like metal-dependent hydrolase (beta-lactamase superfamily II)